MYNNEEILENCLLNSLEHQNIEYELILIDNRQGKFKSAADALNFGGNQSNGDLLLFVHQDVKFFEKNLEEIINYYKKSENLGVAGVAGTELDSPRIRSNGIHHIPPESMASIQIEDIELAQTVDELLLIIPKKVFNEIQFDGKTCDQWHLYGADYCLQSLKHGYNVYIFPIKLYHVSNASSMSLDYYKTLRKILNKYKNDFEQVHTVCLGTHNTNKTLKVDLLYYSDKYNIIPILEKLLKKSPKLHKISKKILE